MSTLKLTEQKLASDGDGADAGGGDDVDGGDLDGFLIVGRADEAVLGFYAEDGAVDGVIADGEVHFGAADLVDDVREGRVFGDIDLEAAEGAADGIEGGIGDALDATGIAIADDHAFEDVIDLVGFEMEFGLGVAGDGALVLEETDAGGEENDAADGDFGVGFDGGRLVGASGIGLSGLCEGGAGGAGDGQGEDGGDEGRFHGDPPGG